MLNLITKLLEISFGKPCVPKDSAQDLQVLWSECPGPILREQT